MLLYYLFILPVSLLPFPVLYLISDFLYFVLYSVFGYRKKVVRKNLKNSFPQKTHSEIIAIEKKFYSHFCDLVVEAFKSFTISKHEIEKRMLYENPELANAYYRQGKSLIFVGGHYNNWEWIATSLGQQINHKALGIYTTLSNKFFDEKMRVTRGRFGLQMISTKIVAQVFEENKDKLTATIFAIDQSPGNPNRCHWMTFLNQDTGVVFGAEKYAKEYNMPVVFGAISKIKRGYYSLRFSVVTDAPQLQKEGEIMEAATKILEQDILAAPQYWLWTHRRWKHKRVSSE